MTRHKTGVKFSEMYLNEKFSFKMYQMFYPSYHEVPQPGPELGDRAQVWKSFKLDTLEIPPPVQRRTQDARLARTREYIGQTETKLLGDRRFSMSSTAGDPTRGIPPHGSCCSIKTRVQGWPWATAIVLFRFGSTFFQVGLLMLSRTKGCLQKRIMQSERRNRMT